MFRKKLRKLREPYKTNPKTWRKLGANTNGPGPKSPPPWAGTHSFLYGREIGNVMLGHITTTEDKCPSAQKIRTTSLSINASPLYQKELTTT
jgi:hypothetical protein